MVIGVKGHKNPAHRDGKRPIGARLSRINRARLAAAAEALGTSSTEILELLCDEHLTSVVQRELSRRQADVEVLLRKLGSPPKP